MAEGIVNFVLSKLGDAAVKEVLRIYGVSGQVEKMGLVLRWAQAFLKDADKSRRLNERQKYWVKLVRDVTYDIEDVIDSFLSLELDAQRQRAQEAGKRAKVKNIIMRWLRKPTKLPELYSLGNNIEEIEKKIDEIERSRDIWDVNSLGDNGGDVGIRRQKQIIVPDNDDPDVVGFDKDRDNIVLKLLDQDSKRLHVISIVAQGGAGKTTLAKKVYNSLGIRRNFDLHLWITVSQNFELLGIMRSIAEQLKMEPPPSLEGHHLNNLYECLNGKRYIIVLDDVWSENLWAELRKVMPDNNGSRVLMTSRFEDVAMKVDATHTLYHLQLLRHEVSLELFLKKAFPQNPNEYYTNNLSEISELFIKICGGLPLALVVLGGILSNEEPTHDAWERVIKRMNQHGVGNEVSEVLASSYDYLPFALKSCFMYFAAFPEDFEIEALPLQRMWIAEGLIPQDDGSTLEDTARDFLEDLAKRNMIEVSRAVCDGSINFCSMHDLMRDVAIRKAHDENFLTVCSNPEEQSFSEARRIAVHQPNCDEVMECANPNLRSLFFSECIPNCSGHRYIKVIGDMRDPFLRIDDIKIVGFERFTQLRYARFYSKVLDFENSIGRMRNLQTLEFQYFEHNVDLPDCFWNIKTLRHVIFPCFTGVGSLGPPPKVSLKNLQTLMGIRNRESWARGNLPNLPNLRTFSIAMTERLQIEVIVEFLCTLKKLNDLVLTGRDLLIDTSKFPFCANLTKFGYFGIGGSFQATDSSLFLINVTQLILGDLEMQQHHIALLEKLAKLIFLAFSGIQFVGGKIMFSTKGFPCLRGLQFNWSNNVEELHIEKGAMPLLQQLRVVYCDNLELPQGLKYLTKLNTLQWYADPESATTTIEDIRQLCEHVPTIMTEGLPQRRH
ncbi:hypothetical protein LUZ63_010367 [Rhynchospora breviuscula]|uniref:Uncharacterized protein n=1 Tax=Rhynchospora breviuscula TaxID=2022672 RepID=A0A9Q0CGR2_9POAL|nr:hypothetical protein LUZ63_010367 [Rhynchospora breviuscula]